MDSFHIFKPHSTVSSSAVEQWLISATTRTLCLKKWGWLRIEPRATVWEARMLTSELCSSIPKAETLHFRSGCQQDGRTKVEKTPLHVAAQEGHHDVARLLLSNGADVETTDMVGTDQEIIMLSGSMRWWKVLLTQPSKVRIVDVMSWRCPNWKFKTRLN